MKRLFIIIISVLILAVPAVSAEYNYIIKFHANADGVTGLPENQSSGWTTNGNDPVHLQSLTIPVTIPVRPGYIFDGWYTSSSGGDRIKEGSIYTFSQPSSPDTTCILDLFAHWKKMTFSLTSDYDNNAIAAENGTQMYIEDGSIWSEAKFTSKRGYKIFDISVNGESVDGWSADSYIYVSQPVHGNVRIVITTKLIKP